MEDDWLKDIHDRMADYETDEPCGLWDGICEAWQREEEAKAAGRRRSVAVRLWTRRVAAAAATVALVISIGLYIKGYRERTSDFPATAALGTTGAIAEEIAANSRDASGDKPTAPAKDADFVMRRKGQPAAAVPNTGTDTEAVADSVPDTGQSAPKETPDARQHKQQRHRDISTRNTRRNNHYIAQAGTGNGGSGRLSFGVFTTGSTGAALSSKSAGDTMVQGIGPDEAAWEDSPMLGILLYNQGKEVKTDIKHRLPVRAGISVAYRIDRRLSIESGVTYTNLTSDIREGSESHYFTGEQTLHYVGIPLRARYRLASWKKLELYASSGLLAEKCVAGTIEKEYVLNNRVGKKETQDLDAKPFQLSVNAAAGVQYNISPSAGLYAEPSISYHFDDGTSLRTVYKDRPLNLGLNLGLRFTVGK